jgi:hypothetical protein
LRGIRGGSGREVSVAHVLAVAVAVTVGLVILLFAAMVLAKVVPIGGDDSRYGDVILPPPGR